MKPENKILVVLGIFILFIVAIPIMAGINSAQNAGKLENIYTTLNSNEEGIIYLGSKDCSYCSMFNPVIKGVTEDNDLEYSYLDVSTISDEEFSALLQELKLEGEFGTPYTAVVKDGVVQEELRGYVDESKFTNFLVEAGLLDDSKVVEIEEVVNEEAAVIIDRMANSEEPILVYLGSSSCGYCTQYNPVIKEASVTYNFEYDYIDLTTVSESEYNEIIEIVGGGFGTPHTVIIKDGKVEAELKGYVPEERLVDFLKGEDFING